MIGTTPASAPKRVALIGTSHTYQIPGNTGADVFANRVRCAVETSDAAAIAEEMSCEALAQKRASDSICSKIAEELGVAHIYCDPDSETRKQRQIQGESTIRMDGWQKGDPPEITNERVRRSHSLRESYWLEQILRLDKWPVLFICGANHVSSFFGMIQANDLLPEILEQDWCP